MYRVWFIAKVQHQNIIFAKRHLGCPPCPPPWPVGSYPRDSYRYPGVVVPEVAGTLKVANLELYSKNKTTIWYMLRILTFAGGPGAMLIYFPAVFFIVFILFYRGLEHSSMHGCMRPSVTRTKYKR